MPTGQQLADFRSASKEPYTSLVSGNFVGSTDEIIQWAAWKWGVDEDVIRAVAVLELDWRQDAVGNRGVTFGLMQVKTPLAGGGNGWPGTFPLARDSTPFNADYYGRAFRSCYNGRETWLGGGYSAGDGWGWVGLGSRATGTTREPRNTSRGSSSPWPRDPGSSRGSEARRWLGPSGARAPNAGAPAGASEAQPHEQAAEHRHDDLEHLPGHVEAHQRSPSTTSPSGWQHGHFSFTAGGFAHQPGGFVGQRTLDPQTNRTSVRSARRRRCAPAPRRLARATAAQPRGASPAAAPAPRARPWAPRAWAPRARAPRARAPWARTLGTGAVTFARRTRRTARRRGRVSRPASRRARRTVDSCDPMTAAASAQLRSPSSTSRSPSAARRA